MAVSVLVGAAVALPVAVLRGLSLSGAAAKNAWALSDGLFVAGLMMAGVGALVLIASTGFFDMFSYAFHSLLVLFSPLRSPENHETFYDYKMARSQKRGAPVAFIFLTGVAYLLLSLLCLGLYYMLA